MPEKRFPIAKRRYYAGCIAAINFRRIIYLNWAWFSYLEGAALIAFTKETPTQIAGPTTW